MARHMQTTDHGKIHATSRECLPRPWQDTCKLQRVPLKTMARYMQTLERSSQDHGKILANSSVE